ncbi:hypothetical protein VPNG_03483 [Cytospora leucostoma]|uniref:Glycosyltransferase 2-like domain-containing protein n=1 Tax=Cytospora leucostoma TaxID=1230097 RepID=A0A423XFP7_9PEZI|nr:hypothetical protein VPNG_03483 [Cytospora leucostoma]
MPKENPKFQPQRDAFVIVPTISAGRGFEEAIRSWLANQPLEVLIITVEGLQQSILDLVAQTLDSGPSTTITTTDIRVLTIPRASKRQQLACGIQAAKGSILVLVDDDVFWPPTLLPLVLACFECPRIGGVGTRQRGKIESRSVWEHLAARRLAKRNRDVAAMAYLNGSMRCLSGRTAVYRAEILQSKAFIDGFLNVYWMGRYLLDSGDDKFLTRYLLRHNWLLTVQTHLDAEVTTVLETSPVSLVQVLRWSRNAWRSYLRAVFLTPQLWG